MKAIFDIRVAVIIAAVIMTAFFWQRFDSITLALLGAGFFTAVVSAPIALAIYMRRRRGL